MSNVEFKDGELQFLYDKSSQVSEVFAQSMRDWHSVQSETAKEFANVQSEISLEINFIVSQLDRAYRIKNSIEKRIDETNRKIRAVPHMPPAPSIATDVNPQKRAEIMKEYADKQKKTIQTIKNVENENAKCREEISKLENSKRQLGSGILNLEQCFQRLNSVKSELSAHRSTLDGICTISESGFSKSVSDSGTFCNALSDTCSRVAAVLQVESNFGFDGRALFDYFKIHSTVYSSFRSSVVNSFNVDSSVKASDVTDAVSQEGSRKIIIVKNKRREEVFNYIERESDPHIILKIPAANLHSLGGQQFIDEMTARMFVLVKKDGNIIGSDGYIVWEK